MDGSSRALSRRRFLAGGATAALGAANAGCLFRGSDGTPAVTDDAPDATGTAATATTGTETESAATASETPVLEVIHGWTGGPSWDGIEALTAAFDERHDVETNYRPISDPADMTHEDIVLQRIENDAPPGTFAATPGANLQRFAGSLSGPIHEHVWTDESLVEHALSGVEELCRLDGDWAAVPLCAFRTNDLFYNVDVFESAGVDPTELDGVDALLNALEAVATETDATPFAHSLHWPWATLQLLATVVVAREGVDAYRSILERRPDEAAVERSFETIATLLGEYGSEDATELTWMEFAQQVAEGNAAVLQQGTWAASEFTPMQRAYGEDWGAMPFPGTAGTPLVHLWSFVAPADNPTPTKAETWLSFTGSATGQAIYNSSYTSIPARDDVDPAQFDDFQTDVYAALIEADELLPSLGHGVGLAPDTLGAALDAMDRTVGPEMDASTAAAAFVDAVR